MTRRIIIAVLCCTLLLLGGYAGYRGYKVWKQQRHMDLALAFAEKGDGRNAMLSVQQALRLNPRHLEATRLAAHLADEVGSPGAILWHNRVLELVPDSVQDRLNLTRTAIRLGNYAAATNALAGMNPAGRQTFEYHNLSGSLAAAAGQYGIAESHMLESVKLQPTNQIAHLSLAVLRLGSSNELDRAEARLSLRRQSLNITNGPLAIRALRELVNDALRTGDKSNALTLSRELASLPTATFDERMLRLEVLHRLQDPELKPTLASLQREALDSTNAPGKTAGLADWQVKRMPPRETLAWLETLPAEARTNPPVAIMVADCLAALSEWDQQHALLSKQSWGELDFVRHAYLSRSLRSQKLDGAAKGEWELALKAANSHKAALPMLLALAGGWGWQSEGEEILWALYNRSPGEKRTAQALIQVLYLTGRTRPLLTVFNQELKRNPSDLELKNNLALTAMLLEAWEYKPHELASEVYAQAPTNAAFASTYAFSMHLQKKDAEALKILRSLPASALQSRSLAGYYGIILNAVGEQQEARTQLERALTGHVLPEERRMFQAALSQR